MTTCYVRLLPLTLLLGQAAPESSITVHLEGLRSQRGIIRACLIRSAAAFPDCSRDPEAMRLNVPATAGELRFEAVEPGEYALALFHDENANSRLDTVLGIPREGFGFSRNPVVRFGAPKFNRANITIHGSIIRLNVRMQYVL